MDTIKSSWNLMQIAGTTRRRSLIISHMITMNMNPFCLHLFYFLFLPLLGFLLLALLPMKHPLAPRPTNFDLFFMSVSATTVSSMTSVELESFSNSQLLVLTFLMLAGGEVFTSMLPILFRSLNHHLHRPHNQQQLSPPELELGMNMVAKTMPEFIMTPTDTNYTTLSKDTNYTSAGTLCLFYLVLGYLILVHLTGSIVILVYLSLFASPRALLESRGIPIKTFAVFITVSSFANCGFIPTNEGMEPFRDCSGILIVVAVLVLLGNTMYPIGLRTTAWFLRRITTRKNHDELDLILSGSLGHYDDHLMSGWREVGMLGVTVSSFIAIQAVMFGWLEWRSEGLEGMNGYQKAIGSVFMAINSRHAGESIVDLSAVAPAILVLYLVMM